jgi:hypothetical protein
LYFIYRKLYANFGLFFGLRDTALITNIRGVLRQRVKDATAPADIWIASIYLDDEYFIIPVNNPPGR